MSVAKEGTQNCWGVLLFAEAVYCEYAPIIFAVVIILIVF